MTTVRDKKIAAFNLKVKQGAHKMATATEHNHIPTARWRGVAIRQLRSFVRETFKDKLVVPETHIDKVFTSAMLYEEAEKRFFLVTGVEDQTKALTSLYYGAYFLGSGLTFQIHLAPEIDIEEGIPPAFCSIFLAADTVSGLTLTRIKDYVQATVSDPGNPRVVALYGQSRESIEAKYGKPLIEAMSANLVIVGLPSGPIEPMEI